MGEIRVNKRIKRIVRRDELRLQALVGEVQKLRDVQVQIISNQRQILVLALASASVAVPLLLAQSVNLPPVILAELLYALAIIYAAIAMNYASDSYSIGLIGRYISQQNDPEVDRIIQQDSRIQVPHWETYLIPARTRFLPYFLNNMGSIGTLILLLAPGALCLAIARYIFSLPTPPTIVSVTIPRFFDDLLPILSATAWLIYVLAILSQLVARLSWRVFKNKTGI